MPPLVALCLGVLAGVLLGPILHAPPAAGLLAAVVCLQLAWAAGRLGAGHTPTLALAGAGLCLGLARYALLPPALELEGEVRLRGSVVQVSGKEVLVDVSSLAGGGEEVRRRGRVRVRLPETGVPTGARLFARGEARSIDPTRLPGEPDPVLAALRQGVRSRVRAEEVRIIGAPPADRRVDRARHGGLLRAMLDGRCEGIPPPVVELLRETGTWHIVSISGLHVGLVAGLAAGVVGAGIAPLRPWIGHRGPRIFAALAAVAAAVAYGEVAGWPAPALRSVWMVGVAALLGVARLVPGAWETLALAAAASLVGEPARVEDLGWQLSFASLAGVLLLRPRVLRGVPPDTPRPLVWVAEGVAATVGATLGTLPVVAWRFQDVAPLAAPANLWAIPWMGAVATPLVLLAEALPDPLGLLALCFADAAVDVGLWGLRYFQAEPWHPAVGPLGALALALLLGARKDLLFVAAGALIVVGLGRAPGAELQVWYLAVGQGDAALVRWPDGRDWLVDTGPPGPPLVRTLRRLGVRRLDRLVVSHDHPDHVGGLAELAAVLPIGTVQTGPAGLREPPPSLRVRTHAARGDPFERLHPLGGWRSPARDPVNDESLVVRLAFGRRRFLFLGDVEAAGEGELVHHRPRADVVKVAHHGSRTSSDRALVERIRPEFAVISCGWENRYGHPHREALLAWEGVRVLRTDLVGTVLVRTDGDSLEVDLVAPPRTTLLEGG